MSINSSYNIIEYQGSAPFTAGYALTNCPLVKLVDPNYGVHRYWVSNGFSTIQYKDRIFYATY